MQKSNVWLMDSGVIPSQHVEVTQFYSIYDFIHSFFL